MLDFSAWLCPRGWTAGPLPLHCPAASVSFALLFVFPLELCWVNSNTLAWLQFPANFHWPGELDSQSETEGKGPFPRLGAGAAADKSLTCYSSCLSSHVMSFAAHGKLFFLTVPWELVGVSLWVRFIGHITFPSQEEQMCQATGKYAIFTKRFFADSFFPWSSVLVTAERTTPAFPMPQLSKLQQLSATDLHHLELEIFLEAKVIIFKEKWPCPFCFQKFCLCETFLQGVNWLLVNLRWWTCL